MVALCSHRAPARRKIELADIFEQHAPAFIQSHSLSYSQHKVIEAIKSCRTARLGGHCDWCQRCGFLRYVYHSCRNRHCPKCQTLAKVCWLEQRQCELLPVPYFHNVFTLPHELNGLILYSEQNRRALLGLLFQTAADTLLAFGRNNLGGRLGFTMVLHTWDQQLRPHFHVHCVIAAGALADNGSQWIEANHQFLFPVRALSKVFRAKYLDGVASLWESLDLPPQLATPDDRHRLLRSLRRKSWVVYSKAPFAGPQKLLDYLGRYTHRVAISNHRLIACQDGQVTFCYRDRRDGDRQKTMTLPADKFIGRFLKHVLPGGFMRIRHYGFLANRAKQTSLAQCRLLLGAAAPQPTEPKTVQQWLLLLTGKDVTRCPQCDGPLRSRTIHPVRADSHRLAAACASHNSDDFW